jgi:GMP synthase-like glutamine amidotransferase
MRRAIVLQHAAHEGPARVASALERAGLELTRCELFAGEPVPTTLAPTDLLVVMGGPMGVLDVEDPRYPFLATELDLLRIALRRDVPLLGICLGAQLVAAAAGARVYPNTVGDPPQPHREVGWGAVHFVRSAEEEPVLAGLDPAEVVLHWHGDTFDLPTRAVLLASTLPCKNQMFRIGRRQFGLQFHVELDEHDIEAWLAVDPAYVRGALGPDGVERLRSDTARYLPRYRARGDRLLEQVVRAMLD